MKPSERIDLIAKGISKSMALSCLDDSQIAFVAEMKAIKVYLDEQAEQSQNSKREK